VLRRSSFAIPKGRGLTHKKGGPGKWGLGKGGPMKDVDTHVDMGNKITCNEGFGRGTVGVINEG